MKLSKRIDALDRGPERVLTVFTSNLVSEEENQRHIDDEKNRFGFREGDQLIHFRTLYEDEHGAVDR